MTSELRIDVWSDVVCPFCYLGKRQLATAVANFHEDVQVTVTTHAFELDPHSPNRFEKPLVEMIAAKYQMPVARAEGLHHRLEQEAAQLGMEWSLSTAQPFNTFDAHRALLYANEQGVGEALLERYFRAYFSESRYLGERDALVELAEEVGLTGLRAVLESDAFGADVRADEHAAMELGITGVPAILIDGRFMIAGAKGADEILSVLQRAWARRQQEAAR